MSNFIRPFLSHPNKPRRPFIRVIQSYYQARGYQTKLISPSEIEVSLAGDCLHLQLLTTPSGQVDSDIELCAKYTAIGEPAVSFVPEVMEHFDRLMSIYRSKHQS